jgi:hypothetical protein
MSEKCLCVGVMDKVGNEFETYASW